MYGLSTIRAELSARLNVTTNRSPRVRANSVHIWLILLALAGVLALGVGLLFYRPMGILFGAIGLCGVGLVFVSMDKSTYPSSARRLIVMGHAVDWKHHQSRRSSWWTFVLMQSPSDRLLLETGIDVPDDVRTSESVIKVTYLGEDPILTEPRAIRIDVVDGRAAGWSGLEDADWFGWWIGVPIGMCIALAAFAVAQNWKRSRGDEENDEPMQDDVTHPQA